jgi:6-phosphogluconolactonase
MRSNVVVVSDPHVLAREGAFRVRQIARRAIDDRGRCMLALAGGRTPRLLYQELATEPSDATSIDWSRAHIFFGDERHVPPEHPDSNYRMVHETLTSRVGIPPDQVHRMRTEQAEAAKVAEEYERELIATFQSSGRARPRFDLVLLGMGSDGHTASLFPRTPVLRERTRLVAAVWVGALHSSRITLTYPVLNAARNILVLVAGVEKADTLRAVLEGPFEPERYPIQGVRPGSGALLWLVDEAAASRLQRSAVSGQR